MPSTTTVDEIFDNPSNHSPWLTLWFDEWNYINYLFTSFVASILFSEVYFVIISVYPNALINIWLLMGMSSLFVTTLMTIFSITSLGFLVGGLVYGLNLYYHAINQVEYELKPLLNLWSSSHTKLYSQIIKHLVITPHFQEMSAYIQNIPGLEGLRHYLQTIEHDEDLKKLIKLLLDIWSTDKLEEKLKIFAFEMIAQVSHEEDTANKIEAIAKLLQYFWYKEAIDIDTFQKMVRHSSLLAPILEPLLNFYENEHDLISKIIDEPRLIEFFMEIHETGSDLELQKGVLSLKALYYYFKCDPDEACTNTQSIWQQMMTHPRIDWIEHLFFNLNQDERFQTLAYRTQISEELLKLFSKNKAPTHPSQETIETLSDIIITCALKVWKNQFGPKNIKQLQALIIDNQKLLNLVEQNKDLEESIKKYLTPSFSIRDILFSCTADDSTISQTKTPILLTLK
jgi:hypothetical protein